MRLSLSFILLLSFPWLGKAQIIIQERFEIGNWQSSAWLGDTARFHFQADRLRLIDSIEGSSELFHPCPPLAPGRWDLHGELDFNPSSTNFLEMRFFQDEAYPIPYNYGYLLQIGGNSNDMIQFFREDTGQRTILAQSTADWVDRDPLEFHLSVRRDSFGLWQIWADTGSFDHWSLLMQVLDSTHRFSRQFGLKMNYTRTRSDRFYLDSVFVEGSTYQDSRAPILDSFRLETRSLHLFFNEKLAPPDFRAKLELEDGPRNSQWAWNTKKANELIWNWDTPLVSNQYYRAYLSGISDRFSNSYQDSLELLFREVLFGEIRFTEVMSDPYPKVYLGPEAFPEVEFIELINRSKIPINTGGMLLEVGSKQYRLGSYDLEPDSLLVLSGWNSNGLWPDARPLLFIDWPSYALGNEAQHMALYTPKGLLVDELNYEKAWHDPIKADGGWSLERIDTDCACGNPYNWQSSKHPYGASPGSINSIAGIYSDTTLAKFLHYEVPKDDSLVLLFDRPLRPITALSLSSALNLDTSYRRDENWHLSLSEALREGQLHWLSFRDSLHDCANVPVLLDSIPLALAQKPEQGEIQISEVLFNPHAEGSDFVEIYNRSDHFFDLANLRLALWDDALIEPRSLSQSHRILLPSQAIALTADLEHLIRNYAGRASNLQQADLPSMPDDGVALALSTSDLELIDRISVEEAFHHPFLGDPEGVSLYRLDYSKFATNQEQWESSPRNLGYASPGVLHYFKTSETQSLWAAEPNYISPNGDGYHDVLNFRYNLDSGAWIKVDLFNRQGKWIKSLCAGEFAAGSGAFPWRGKDAQQEMCPAGIYIALLEYQYPNGRRGFERCVVVLSQ